jgi:tetratricopeptide (TPR) repeat protein
MTTPPNLREQVQAILNALSEFELQQWLESLQSNPTQINLGNAKGFQVVVKGGTAYIGDWNIGADLLKTVLRELLSDRRAAELTGIPHNIPRSGAVNFVGRKNDLERLHTQLQQSDRLAVTSVQGMGGIGKTELAVQYALSHYQKQTYPGGVCWLQARDLDLGSQITRFALTQLGLTIPDDLELADQVAFCWRRWPTGDALVVLDDVTDYQAIGPYLPPVEPRFKVLMTTRLQLGASVKQVAIEVLEEDAALELLTSLIGAERVEQQLDAAKALCRWLGYLPLGLELVGRYLTRKEDLSLSQMQQRLEEQKLAARALSQVEAGMTATLGVAAAFELSWKELSEPAQRLGYMLSLFALEPIPWSLVEKCCAEQEPEELEETRDQGLVALSLLQRQGQGSYQLHQLIHEFFQAKLRQFPPADTLKQQFCRVMVEVAQQIPQSPTQAQIVAVTTAMPHVAEAALALPDCFSDEELWWPYAGLGRFYAGQGAYAQALPWYKQGLSMVQTRLGPEHPDVASSLHNLAWLYHDQGRYEAAEPLYQQALELNQRLLGLGHPDVATSLHNLAGLYQAQGRYEAAEPLLQQALELRQQLLGPEHPDVANSLHNLAVLYHDQGRYEAAEPLYQQALELIQRLLGAEHPAVASSLHNLAALYYDQGRYKAGEALYWQTIAIAEAQLGMNHPRTIALCEHLAALYCKQAEVSKACGLYDEAVRLLERAVELRLRFQARST